MVELKKINLELVSGVEQGMSLLEFKNKFDVQKHRKIESINEQEFFRWTSNHFYRTSYNDMRSNVSETLIMINTSQENKYLISDSHRAQ